MKRARRALPMAFVVWLTTTVAAAVPAMIGSAAIGDLSAQDPGGALLLERLVAAGPGLAAAATSLVPLALGLLLLSPLLHLSWLSALAEPRSVASALAAGAASYGRGLLVTVILAVPLALILAVGAGTLTVAHLLTDGPSARTHDLVLAALLVPGALGLAGWAAWHDLARAALVAGDLGAKRAAGSSLRALSVGTVSAYVGWLALGLGLQVAAHLAGHLLDGPGALRLALVLVVTQALAFGRVLCRGAWLGRALDAVEGAERRASRARAAPPPQASPVESPPLDPRRPAAP